MPLESKLEKLCRAEYDDSISDCFEGVPATYIFAPLFCDYDTKLVTGDRGVGKTHLFRVLARETPIELYSLDKEKLIENAQVKYNLLEAPKHNKRPNLVVVDDLHYLLKSMQLYSMKKGECREENVLDNLDAWEKYAKDNKAVLVFVADDCIYGLSERFSKNENKKRFLEIFKKCVHTGDDEVAIFNNRIKDSGYFNFNLNNRGIGSISNPDFDTTLMSEIWSEELKFYAAADMNQFPKQLGFSESNFSKRFRNWGRLKSYVEKMLKNEDEKLVSYDALERELLFNNNSASTTVLENKYLDFDYVKDFIIQVNENKNWEDTAYFSETFDMHFGQYSREKTYHINERAKQMFNEIKNTLKGRHCYFECPDLSDKNIEIMKHDAIAINNNRSREMFVYRKVTEINKAMAQVAKNLSRAFRITDIPLYYPVFFGNQNQAITFNFDGKGYLDIKSNEIEQIGRHASIYDRPSNYTMKLKNVGQIATMRQLKVLNEVYGGINRHTLGINYGSLELSTDKQGTETEDSKPKSIDYTVGQLREIKKILNHLYHREIGADSSLVKELLYYEADKTVEGILTNDLRHE